MGIRICPDCGGKVSTSRNECPHCGYLFSDSKTCPECGASISKDIASCPECGYEFINKETVESATKGSGSYKSTSIVSITCPNCGYSGAKKDGDHYICESCGSTFMVDKGPDTIINGDVIINEVGGHKDIKKYVDGCRAKIVRSENDAKKELLKALYDKKESLPVDIFGLEFVSCELVEKHFVLAKSHVECHVTCSIGYDRIEHYQESVRKYNSTKNDYETVYEDRTRTVTDWRPFATSITDDNIGLYRDDGTSTYGVHGLDKCDNEDIDVSKYSLTDKTISRIKDGSIASVAYRYRYPGDHHDRLNYSGDSYISYLGLYIAPMYVFKANYNGHTITFTCRAYGKFDYECDTTLKPDMAIRGEEYDSLANEIFNLTKKKNGYLIPAIILMVFGVSLTLSGILSTIIPILVVGLVLVVGSIALFVFMNKTINDRRVLLYKRNNLDEIAKDEREKQYQTLKDSIN